MQLASWRIEVGKQSRRKLLLESEPLFRRPPNSELCKRHQILSIVEDEVCGTDISRSFSLLDWGFSEILRYTRRNFPLPCNFYKWVSYSSPLVQLAVCNYVDSVLENIYRDVDSVTRHDAEVQYLSMQSWRIDFLSEVYKPRFGNFNCLFENLRVCFALSTKFVSKEVF